MKKIFLLLFVVLLITACSKDTQNIVQEGKEETTGLQIAKFITSIRAVDGTTEKHKLNYEFVIVNDRHRAIKEDTVEVFFNDWITERLIEQQITQKTFYADSIIIKGNLVFDTTNLTKKDITENEPFVEGIKMSSVSGEEFFMKP